MIASSFREKDRRERGLVLVAVLVLAVLYMAMLQLLLMESSEKSRSAQRIRARIVADILAEDAVELAAEGIVDGWGRTIDQVLEDGAVKGSCQRLPGNRFRLEGRGRTSGLMRSSATVVLEGRILGSQVIIDEVEYARRWN